MKSVELKPLGKSVMVKTNDRVLDALLAKELKVPMACGGKGLCATCHVWIGAGMDKLTPMTAREKRTIGLVTGADERSRLTCQARVLGDGVEVILPDGVFVQATADLESLIGQRATTNILHPVDMRVLITEGKIITRSRIMELKQLDVDMDKLRKDAAAAE
ncbi:MAG: 2Fe-2S iron-sulfur cluster-binding protein [Candidatus Sumerlaeia bacterium]|nr:2Fe-2S iron-sulfur cluster-binding protein [Candidatus Sumerlaeia bacterium]